MSRNDLIVNNTNNLHKSENTKSLLFLAVENNNIEMVRSLLSNPNIDVNSRGHTDSYDKTPLFLAVENGNNEIIRLLLSNEKLDINCLSYKEEKNVLHSIRKRTALHEAVDRNNLEAVQLLLSKDNIDINIISNYYTKGIANINGNTVELNIKIHETALSIAAKNKNNSIMNLIQSKGTNPICLNNCYSFDFKNQKATPNDYLIRTSKDNAIKYYYTQKWIIEGSNDNQTWETIEEVNDSSFLNEKDSLTVIPIFKSNNQSQNFRILRMRTTNICNENPYHFSIDSFEIHQILKNLLFSFYIK